MIICGDCPYLDDCYNNDECPFWDDEDDEDDDFICGNMYQNYK